MYNNSSSDNRIPVTLEHQSATDKVRSWIESLPSVEESVSGKNNNCDLQCAANQSSGDSTTDQPAVQVEPGSGSIKSSDVVVPANQSSDDSTADQPAVQVEPGGGSIKSLTSEIAAVVTNTSSPSSTCSIVPERQLFEYVSDSESGKSCSDIIAVLSPPRKRSRYENVDSEKKKNICRLVEYSMSEEENSVSEECSVTDKAEHRKQCGLPKVTKHCEIVQDESGKKCRLKNGTQYRKMPVTEVDEIATGECRKKCMIKKSQKDRGMPAVEIGEITQEYTVNQECNMTDKDEHRKTFGFKNGFKCARMPLIDTSEIARESTVNEECGMTDKIKKCAVKKRPRGTEELGIETNEVITSSENEAESVTAEEQVIFVPRSNRHSAKIFDKIYYCPVCNVGVVHLPRHLYSVHPDDTSVAEVMSASGKRKQHLLTRLRNLGSHLHNQQVMRDKSGSLSVIYRPSGKTTTDGSEYLPCMYCYGYHRKRQLWRHVRRCPLRELAKPGVKAVTAGKLLLNDAHTPQSVRELVCNMRSGPVKVLVKNDRLLMAMANKMYKRVNYDKHHANNIRARLRKLGRIVLRVRKSSATLQNVDMRGILKPTCFTTVLSAVKEVAGYSESDNCFLSPSVAVDVGRDLKKCAVILKGLALSEGDSRAVKDAKMFLEQCNDEWNDEASGGARRTLQRRKANRPLDLPLASDITKLNAHLHEVQQLSMACVSNAVKDDNFQSAFKHLGSSVLAQLILFNRRRPGEVSKLEMATFRQNCDKKYHSQDAVDSLSALERKLLNNFTRIEVPGKRDNIVPVLITDAQKSAIHLLSNAELRSMAGIAENNPYVFAASMGSMGHIRGNDCLRLFAKECGALNPLQLKSTLLRKHVASLSQIINLKDHEMDQLAGFMGHDIRTHREHYRLPLDVVQTAKVSRVLLAVEKGCISNYSGKTLDEIDISPNDG